MKTTLAALLSLASLAQGQNQCGAASPAPAVQPAVPAPVTDANRGRCNQPISQPGHQTYTWWAQGEQRCFSTYTPPSAVGPTPVLLSMDCYSCDRGLSPNGPQVQAANRYGLSIAILSTPDGNWEFGNNGVVNDAVPLPCSSADSKDNVYLRDVLDFIQARPSTYDAGRIYSEGFSQNSMFALHAAQCFPDDIAGAWQGGSGLALTGVPPTPPGKQAECTASSFEEHRNNCDRIEPCLDCQYWPVKPVGPGLQSCLFTYTNDYLYGTDANMWEVATAPEFGNEIRRVVLEPTDGIEGGHRAPVEKYEWLVSCLEVNAKCSTACESALGSCMRAAQRPDAMRDCLDATASCRDDAGFACAPSLTAMSLGEVPYSTQVHGRPWDGQNQTAVE